MTTGKLGFCSGIVFVWLFLSITIHTANAQSTAAKPEKSLPSFKFGGFLQQQFIADQTPNSPARFSIHRARVGVTGSITDRIKVNLIGGYAEPPNNTPRLVNAFIDFDIHPLFQVRTGQFLLPFGLEGPEPIPLNPAIERSMAIRRLNTFTMFRDIGVQVSGHQSIFGYAVALVNGGGANQIEQNEPKDLMGRIGLTPVENLELGVSGHLGKYQTDPSSENRESRYRAGIDISYRGNPVFMRGEYIIREDEQPAGGSWKMNGGYLLAGYQFTEELQTIARYEYYEPDTSADDDHLNGFTIGASYYFMGNTRISVNYEFRDDQLNTDLGNLLTIQMQVAL